MNGRKAWMAGLVGCLLFLSGCTREGNGEVAARISLEYSTHRQLTEMRVQGRDTTEPNLYYPRVKQLSDGSLLLCFMNDHFGWDIYVSRSEDGGLSWSDAQLLLEKYSTTSTVGEDLMVYANPDFIELNDGRILLAYQWRYKKGYNDLAHTNENCGVGIMTSSDGGRSWSKARSVYRGRCWEPAMLQLPSGEIQMYITSSQNVVNGLSCPRTVVIRSFDGGETWQGKSECGIGDNEIISYTKDDRFGYDGMPTAVLLQDGSIVMSIEVWSGKYVVDQTPMIVRTSAEENWHLDTARLLRHGGPAYPQKKQANKDLIGYGPYLSRLPSGETLLLSNGLYQGRQSSWLFVGDVRADNFGFATTGFDGYWGSVDCLGNDRVLITGTEKYTEDSVVRGKIHLMTGRVNRARNLTRVGDPLVVPETFDVENNDCWYLGRTVPMKVFYDFGCTDEAFVFDTWVFTDKLTAYSVENSDASVILLSKGDDVYKLAVNPSGDYVFYRLDRNSWQGLRFGTTDEIAVAGSINADADEDLGFAARVRIPWSWMNRKPARGEVLRIHPAFWYKARSAEKHPRYWEELQGENPENPQSWLAVTVE